MHQKYLEDFYKITNHIYIQINLNKIINISLLIRNLMIKLKYLYFVALNLFLIAIYTLVFVFMEHELYHIYFISQFISAFFLMIVYEVGFLNKKLSINEIMGGSLVSSIVTILFLIGLFKYFELSNPILLMEPPQGALGLMNLFNFATTIDYVMLFIGSNFVVLLFFLITKFEKKNK